MRCHLGSKPFTALAVFAIGISACAGHTGSALPQLVHDGAGTSGVRKDASTPGMCSIYSGYGALSFCYAMDEASGTTLVDSSSAGNNGTISSTGVAYQAAGLTTNDPNGLTTNGSTGTLTSGYSPTSGSFSVSFFVNLVSDANGFSRLAATGNPKNGNAGTGWNIIIDQGASNDVYANIGYGSGTATFGYIPLPLNTSANVTLTYNASTGVATLCSGGPSAPVCKTTTLTAAYVASGNPVEFGTGPGSSAYYANATFDAATYLQGTVLSSSQIATIAGYVGTPAASTPTPTPAAPTPTPTLTVPTPTPTPTAASSAPICSVYSGSGALSFCYAMDEASGTTLVDSSSAGKNGTISSSGVTYHAAGLTTNNPYGLTTNGSTGTLTSGYSPSNGSFSVSFFVDLLSDANGFSRLAATGNPKSGSAGTGWNIIIDEGSSNDVYANIGYGSGTANFGYIPLPLNTTANVTLTYNSSSGVATLCSGGPSAPVCKTTTLPAAYVASGSPVEFGTGPGSSAYYANATFDGAAYWQGTVLTAAQIGAIAALAGNPPAPSPTPTATPLPTATPSPIATPPPTPLVTPALNDYVTFGYDNQRDVFNPNSTNLTVASMANLHLAWQATVNDYETQGQPILATEIPGHVGVLYLGGASGNVYALDALSGTKLWTAATGQESYSCENGVTEYFGIGGTVAYAPGSASLYVVGNSNTALDAGGTQALFQIGGANGAILGSVNFDPNPVGPSELDFSHTSVALGSNGLAYVGTGGTCDISSWRGRVAAVNVASMTLANTFFPVWGGLSQPWGGGGVWGWGGVSIDANGIVYTGVGNTDNGETEHGAIVPPFVAAPEEYSGLGEAFIKLSPDLSTPKDSNHPIPTTAYSGASTDLDLNGTPVLFTPSGVACDQLAALQGKSGSLYLYDTNHVGAGAIQQYPLAPSTYADGFLGGPAYSPAAGLLYAAVPSSNGSLYPPGMIAINPGCGTPSVAWQTAFGPDSYPGGVPRSVPAVTAGGVVLVGTPCTPTNGSCGTTTTDARSRVARATPHRTICCAPPGGGRGAIWALDAGTGNVLNGGYPILFTDAAIRAPPTVDGDWIYVVDVDGDVYGLTIDPNFGAIQSQARPVRQMPQWEEQPHAPTVRVRTQ